MYAKESLADERLAVMIFFFSLLLLIIYAVLLLTAVLSFKKAVQKPLNELMVRMTRVKKGNFDCKGSVLYSDEVGCLKAHFNGMIDGLLEREKIKDTFGKFVSAEIAEKIMKTGKVNLAGEEVRATVLFSDIRNFTPLSETMTPTELIEFLNCYFSYMVGAIQKNRGVVNKFIGDAVMAIFSPVFDVENHADAALQASIDMRAALEAFNRTGKYPAVKNGTGIHSGTLVAGNEK